MRLSLQDRNEFLKAAIKTSDKDIAAWIVGMVDAIDTLPEGKSDAPVPPYRLAPSRQPAPPAAANGQAELVTHWQP